jgi:hypothetical protein
MSKKFVILTDDGMYRDQFLTWTNDCGGYYTTVADLEDVCKADVYDTVQRAEDRARDADSGTWGGWQAPMTICEILNYDAVINDGEEPDLLPVETIKFN